MSAYMKSSRALALYMSGRTYDDMVLDRELMLNIKTEDLKDLAHALEQVVDLEAICVIGNEEKIRDNSILFKNIVKLP